MILKPLIFKDENDEEENKNVFGFYKAHDYAHCLCEAADAYDMSYEIITSLVQYIGETYGEEAAGKAVGFVLIEWDL